jgi:hypothetical protein
VGADAANTNKEEAEEEAVEFAACLMTEIDDKGKQLAGKPDQVDFTPALLQSATALRLRTKVGHKDQRALSPLAMPSPSAMNRLLGNTRSKEGNSPKNHGDCFDECADLDALIIGHLFLFDKMKLKTGFWRTSDHTVCGFASSSSNSTIKSVLSNNGDDGVPARGIPRCQSTCRLRQPVEVSLVQGSGRGKHECLEIKKNTARAVKGSSSAAFRAI